MAETKELPKGADFTLKVPLDRDKTKFAEFHISDMSEEVYLAAMSLIDANKPNDATRLFIKALQVGGDDVGILSKNTVALLSARKLMYSLMIPLDGELKKN